MEKVYLCKTGSYYKIGVSRRVKQRVSTLQSSNPEELELIGILDVKHPWLVEMFLHEVFSEYNVRGEWFKFDKFYEVAIKDLFSDDGNGNAPVGNTVTVEQLKKAMKSLRK